MGRTGLGVGLAVAALLAGGCGAGAASGEDAGASTSARSGSATAAPPRAGAAGDTGSQISYGPQFPLTLRRTGGIAGFDDSVVLDANGGVRVETRSVHGRVCRLDPVLQRQLLSLLEALRIGARPAAGTGTPGAAGDRPTPVDGAATESDPITISVTDDRARAVDLSDPSLGEVAGLVATLVGDVTLSVPATTRCTSPSSPTSTATAVR